MQTKVTTKKHPKVSGKAERMDIEAADGGVMTTTHKKQPRTGPYMSPERKIHATRKSFDDHVSANFGHVFPPAGEAEPDADDKK